MPTFTALAFKDPDHGFAITFPDLQGCVALVERLPAADRVAARALVSHLAELRAAGETIPAPTPTEVLLDDPDNVAGMAITVRL
jgi:predicted RNase H-like HicB family nuclease